MATTALQTRKSETGSEWPASESIALLSTPRPADDASVVVHTPTPSQESFAPSPFSKLDTNTLNNLNTQLSSRPFTPLSTPPKPLPTMPNNTGSGGGGRSGSSTPNAGMGGGGPTGGGGGGPGLVNAKQFVGVNFGASQDGPATNTTPPSAPAASAHTDAPAHGHASSSLTDFQTTYSMTAPSLLDSNYHPTPPPHGHGQGHGQSSDPLYVLDMNTGETVPSNVTMNTYSTWSENLLAQTSGSTGASYSWNLGQAPDAANISGQNTANLQFNWSSFTGPARTDIISVTENGSLTQTMFFKVAGTDSPAYSATQPTSSSTWPTVITPDQIDSGQATQTAGPYANIGLADGSVQTSFAMPSYNPNTTPVSLDYNSTTANAQSIFLTEYQLPSGQSVPSTITAQLTFNNTPLATVTYDTSELNPGDIVQIGLQANATGLSTGRYPWSITVTNNGTPTTYNGSVDIVNQAKSPYGAGWSLDNAEQLVPVSGGVMLVNPDGTSLFFASNGQGGYTTPAGDFSTLTLSNGTYTRTLTDGTQIYFNSSGQETSTVDRDGNTTTFGYTSGQLTTITDMNGQVTTLAYNSSGLLSSITDPADRTATLSYTGKQLTSITDPADDVWQYAYDSSNDMTSLTDPNNDTTSFTYNFADRISSVSVAGNAAEQLTAMQMNGLAAPGTGTPSNPATAVLLATGDQALFTDGNGNIWTYGLDWLGFGLETAEMDPLGDTTLNYLNANGLAWMSADGLGRPTVDFFDNQGNITEEVAPDDTTQHYQYNSFSEVTKYTDQENDVTTYTYNSKGDLTQETDALNNITTYAYNNAGLVTSTTDPNNNTTTNTYNSLNELASTTNALSGLYTYTYNNAGQMVSSTDPQSNTSTYAYDAMNRLTGKTLPDTPGVYSTYTYTYDKDGNQLTSTDPNDNTTTNTYNAFNKLLSTTNPLDDTTTYGYDKVDNLISVTNPLNQTTTYAYNAANEKIRTTDALGNKTTYLYDQAGELIRTIDPMGNVTVYTYTPRGEQASKTLYASTPMQTSGTAPATSLTTSASPNSPSGGAGLYSSSSALSIAAPKEDAALKESTSSSKSGGSSCLTFFQEWVYNYYACGCLESSTLINIDADDVENFCVPFQGTVWSGPNQGAELGGWMTITITGDSFTGTYRGYAANGYTNTITGAGGTVSGTISGGNTLGTGTLSGTCDFSNYGTNMSIGITGTVTTSYINASTVTGGPPFFLDFQGQDTTVGVIIVVDETTTYDRNADHQITSITDAQNNTMGYSYDGDGNPTSVTDPNGNTTRYAYNGLNEVASATNAEDDAVHYNYNKGGQLASVVDPSGDPTYSYDGQGRLLTVTDDMGGVTSYSYDPAGNLLSVTDPDGNVTKYSYNTANELVSTTNPMGHESTDAYNSAGELTSTTDADGRTIDYAYNADGQETSETWVGGNYTANYQYNADSELTSASDPNSVYTYTYDALGDVTSVSNAGTPGVPTVTLSYAYDGFGNRASLTDSLGGNISYAYNGDNQMTSLSLSISGTLDAQLTMAYDGAGNLTGLTRTAPSVNGDTITSSYAYDKANELTNITDKDVTHNLTLANYTYGYNVDGNVSSYQDNSGNSLTYGYDGDQELTSATGTLNSSNYTFNYNYDSNGNRTSASTDVNGSLTSATYSTGTGNELQSDGTYSYTYDHNGNMTSQTNIQTGSVTYYTWDYENRLTEVKVENNQGQVLQDETFTYDVFGNRIAVALNGTTQLYTVYDGANPYIDFNGSGQLTERYLTNPKGMNQFYGQVNASGATQWYLTDNLGSIRQVVDTSGNVLDAIAYDPYGNVLNQTNAANAPRLLYAGGAYDSITGDYQFGHREENPTEGRWLSPDPFGLRPDTDPYRYAYNDPTTLTDPTGEFPVLFVIVVVTVVAAGGAGFYFGYNQPPTEPAPPGPTDADFGVPPWYWIEIGYGPGKHAGYLCAQGNYRDAAFDLFVVLVEAVTLGGLAEGLAGIGAASTSESGGVETIVDWGSETWVE